MSYWKNLIREKRTLAGFFIATVVLSVTTVVMAVRLAKAPIYVIPGAKEGTYWPTSYESQVVAGFAERIAVLYMNYNPANVEATVKEAAACFTPELYSKAAEVIRNRIKVSQEKQISQSFYVREVKVNKDRSGVYTASVKGSYAIFAGGAPAGNGETTLVLKIVKGKPTPVSPLGLYVAAMYETGSS